MFQCIHWYGGLIPDATIISCSVFNIRTTLLGNGLLSKMNNQQQQDKELTWRSMTAIPQTLRGHTGHGLGPGHSWLMQLGKSGKWLSKQRPGWLPLTGTSALSPLIHSEEPQSNTQRHTVTSNNTAQSEGTRNESCWPKMGDRQQFAHQIWARKTGLSDDHRVPLWANDWVYYCLLQWRGLITGSELWILAQVHQLAYKC